MQIYFLYDSFASVINKGAGYLRDGGITSIIG